MRASKVLIKHEPPKAAALFASHFSKGGKLARGQRGILKRRIYTAPCANPPSPPLQNWEQKHRAHGINLNHDRRKGQTSASPPAEPGVYLCKLFLMHRVLRESSGVMDNQTVSIYLFSYAILRSTSPEAFSISTVCLKPNAIAISIGVSPSLLITFKFTP